MADVVYKFKADTGSFNANVNKSKNTLSSFIKVAIGLKAVQIAFSALKAGVMYSASLDEAMNVLQVTFGENSKAMVEFGETAIQNFGMSELSARKMGGTFGSIFKAMDFPDDEVLNMSKSMTGLVGDFASFYDMSHEEAFNTLKAGITGEMEPLKSLGIVMNQASLDAFALESGLGKTTAKMTEQEKTLLRYNFIMDATKDVTGDFIRTQDSFTNQLRIAQAQLQALGGIIGGVLKPALTSLLTTFNLVIAGFLGGGEAFSFAGIGEKLTADIELILARMMEFGRMLIPKLQTGLLEGLSLLSGEPISAGILNMFVNIPANLLEKGIELATWFFGGLVQGFGTAGEALDINGSIIRAFNLEQALEVLGQKALELANAFYQSFGVGLLEYAGLSVGDTFLQTLASLPEQLYNKGMELASRLFTGLSEKLYAMDFTAIGESIKGKLAEIFSSESILTPINSMVDSMMERFAVLRDFLAPVIGAIGESFTILKEKLDFSAIGGMFVDLFAAITSVLDTLSAILAPIIATLLPVLVDLFATFVSNVLPLAVTFLLKVADTFKIWGSVMIPIIGAILPALVSVIKFVVTAIMFLIGILLKIGMVILTVFGVYFKVAGAVLLALVQILIKVGTAIVQYLILKFNQAKTVITTIKGVITTLKGSFSQLVSKLKELASAIQGSLIAQFNKLKQAFTDTKQKATDLGSALKGSLVGAFNSVKDAIAGAFGKLGDFASKVSSVASSVGDFVGSITGGIFGSGDLTLAYNNAPHHGTVKSRANSQPVDVNGSAEGVVNNFTYNVTQAGQLNSSTIHRLKQRGQNATKYR